jgi:hypothetical protein
MALRARVLPELAGSLSEGCLRRQVECKVRRRKAAAGGEKAATAGKGNGTGRSVKRPMLFAPEDLDKKLRELRDSRQVAGQPVLQHPSVLQAVASVVSRQGSWAVGGGSAGGVAHAIGAGCSVGVA